MSNAVFPMETPPSPTTAAALPFTGDSSSSSESQFEKPPRDEKPVLSEADLIKKGKKKISIHKYILTAFIFTVNFLLIFASWWWAKYYYIYLWLICMPVALNVTMIINICIWQAKNLIFKPKLIMPENPETMVLLMPCYNETYEECSKSLDSLVNQVNIDHHKKAIMVICDGKVRGPGMEKSTGQYLNEDILVDQTERRMLKSAYVAWDGQMMDIEISKGVFKGVPFFCIVKQQNQGKRDSLIVIRSFVYKFNVRHEQPKVIFTPEFFSAMSDWLVEAGIDNIDHLIGMDADTVFADDCISHLLIEARHPKTIGVCGYVAVDFATTKWNIWSIYQSAEYTIAQGLRRLHQSVVTHKVSCLPGCCQLLRVCDETCGDRILIDLFGYHPKLTDGMLKQIRATASEDRNHVCLMLMEFTHAQTRQALKARAYTDVPHSMSVFLSQRRRWTLGATSNDLMLVTSSPLRFNLFERFVAFSNVTTWTLNFFVIASLACMVNAFIHQPLWITMAFASVMFVPVSYYLVMSIWLPRNRLERCQFLVGLAIFVTCGPFINVSVSLYAIFYMDNFSWGKTRQVIAEDPEAATVGGNTSDEDGDDTRKEKTVEPPPPGLFVPPDDPAGQASGHRVNTVADLENQLDQIRQPYVAPAGRRTSSTASSIQGFPAAPRRASNGSSIHYQAPITTRRSSNASSIHYQAPIAARQRSDSLASIHPGPDRRQRGASDAPSVRPVPMRQRVGSTSSIQHQVLTPAPPSAPARARLPDIRKWRTTEDDEGPGS